MRNLLTEVIKMKHDLLFGILVGAVLGLVFTAHLQPYLPFLVIATVLVMAKVINIK